jgi:type II secretory ATPase GspE/PulE/Tfp pilus assembly ATPase PilB-like protein
MPIFSPSRLFDLGLKPFVVASALEAIVAQRLVRRICDECRAPANADAELLQRLGGKFAPGIEQVFAGTGCQACYQSGYKGRVGLYEVLVPDKHLRHLIASQAAVTEIIEYARDHGFTTLRDDAFNKVSLGLTTLDEVFRVLGPE